MLLMCCWTRDGRGQAVIVIFICCCGLADVIVVDGVAVKAGKSAVLRVVVRLLMSIVARSAVVGCYSKKCCFLESCCTVD